ncbi:MAG: twin-arginine translocase subunit TatC [Firmicutes bacterium HGW-Firmicutes-15]|nr:MAG: twin-arginine translocase subunit TatC [Firmicutes bacterium HGW-Firmicutes-15]
MAFKNLSADDKQTVIQHFEELRKSIIISVVAILVAALACFNYNEQLLGIVTLPLRSINQRLIVTGVTEAFFVKLQISILAGFVIAFPIVSWSIWRFIKPALYPHERKYIYILFPITLILFAAGVLFSYFGILPLVLKFFVYIAGENLDTMFKVDQYVSFVMSFSIPFGLVFELPVITFFLTKIGVVKPEMLSKNRKYALLIIVVAAGALTPGPDPISQIMMAVPVYILYEVSIIVAKFAKPGRNNKKDDQQGKSDDEVE